MILTTKEVFVFGSNRSGVHGAGAARLAYLNFHIPYGFGEGLYCCPITDRKCYALPTKDHSINTLRLEIIKSHILILKSYCNAYKDLTFYITRVGCGLAGYTDEQIAPLFENFPENCLFPIEWKPYLKDKTYFDDIIE